MTEAAAVTLEDQHFPSAHLRELISDVDAEAHIKARRYDLLMMITFLPAHDSTCDRLDLHIRRVNGGNDLPDGHEGVRVMGEALDALAEELKAEGKL